MTGGDYRSVAARIRQELPELDRVARRACRAWASASRDPDDLYVDAAALNVHGFYAGLERVFTLVAVLIEDLPQASERISAQLAAFADVLEAIGAASAIRDVVFARAAPAAPATGLRDRRRQQKSP